MNNWFFIAILAPVLWSFVNILDHYLIERFSIKEKERSSGAHVIFSSLIGIIIAVVIGIFTKGIFSIPTQDIGILIIVGFLTVSWIILYLYALEMEHVSAVVPYFLLVPIFGYILAGIFLQEALTYQQILGSIVTLVGLVIISIDFGKYQKQRKKIKVMIYMVLACMFAAISGVLFKYVTVQENFWISSFWEYLGIGIAGALIYLCIPGHRKGFHIMNKTGGKQIVLVNIISEVLSISGNLLTNFALVLAPVALVYLVGSFQPAIVLAITLIGSKITPAIITEDVSFRVLAPKMVAIVLMITGSVMIFI